MRYLSKTIVALTSVHLARSQLSSVLYDNCLNEGACLLECVSAAQQLCDNPALGQPETLTDPETSETAQIVNLNITVGKCFARYVNVYASTVLTTREECNTTFTRLLAQTRTDENDKDCNQVLGDVFGKRPHRLPDPRSAGLYSPPYKRDRRVLQHNPR